MDEPLVDWGKQQQRSLSHLLRRLLTNARDDESHAFVAYPEPLKARYDHLIQVKLRSGLNADQEAELADVRAHINAHDRESGALAKRESASSVVDQELADLRREAEPAFRT